MPEMSFTEWSELTQDRRAELIAYSKEPLPADLSERHADIDKAIQNASDAGALLADAESFLTQAKAQAMFKVLGDHPDLSAKERELVIKDKCRQIQRIVDGLAVVQRAIRDRIYSNQNANRAGV